MTDKEIHWLDKASRYGGSFVKHFALSCMNADEDNFVILNPILKQIMTKYPKYSEENVCLTQTITTTNS